MPDAHDQALTRDDVLLHRALEERQALEARLENAKAALIEFEREAKAREEAAHERGMAEGIATSEAAAREAQATHDAALREGVTHAVDAFREQMGLLETLAIDLALASLERIFGNASDDAIRVSKTIAHHVRQMTGETIIGIDVSPQDFPSDDSLARAFDTPELAPAVKIIRNPDLSHGECTIRLHSCEIDASPPSQLKRIRTTLEACRS